MWETDLVQARSDRAWLPRSYISSQMGIGTRELCHVPFVVSNKCFFSAADVVKAFPPLSPSLSVEPWHPSAPSRYSLAWELVTHVIGWQGSFSQMGVGCFPAFSSNPAASSVFISDSRYKRPTGIGKLCCWRESLMYCESCLFRSLFFVFPLLAKKFWTTCSFTIHQSGVEPKKRRRESDWMRKRDRV